MVVHVAVLVVLHIGTAIECQGRTNWWLGCVPFGVAGRRCLIGFAYQLLHRYSPPTSQKTLGDVWQACQSKRRLHKVCVPCHRFFTVSRKANISGGPTTPATLSPLREHFLCRRHALIVRASCAFFFHRAGQGAHRCHKLTFSHRSWIFVIGMGAVVFGPK